MGKIIHCEYCGKTLFILEDGENLVRRTMELGYIYKMPFLYKPNVPSVVFCSKSCCKSWFEEEVGESELQSGREQLQRLRSKTPEIVRNMSEVVLDFKNKLEHIKQELKSGRKLKDILVDSGVEAMKNSENEFLNKGNEQRNKSGI